MAARAPTGLRCLTEPSLVSRRCQVLHALTGDLGLNAAFPVLALLASSFLPRGIKNRSRDESKPRLLTEQSGFYGGRTVLCSYVQALTYVAAVFGNAYFGLVIILFILLWTSCKALVPNEAAWVGVETFR